VKKISLFSVPTFEHCNHVYLTVLLMMNLILIGVKDGDSSGKSVTRCDPTESKANEEAHGPPAESARL